LASNQKQDKWEGLAHAQREICTRWKVTPVPILPDTKVGIARNVHEDLEPLNALRHPPESGTSGWFIWRGESLSTDADFFLPMHASHLDEILPMIVPYLALPPGWRVLLAPGYEDVWEDSSLLDV
jgi:hypothetical protein